MNPTGRRQLDFRNFDQVLSDVHELSSRGYIRAGRWTLGQIAEHLATGMNSSIDGCDYKFSWFVRLPSALILRHILRTRRVPEGMKIPKSYQPPLEITDGVGIDHLATAIDRFERHRWPWAPHPYFGEMERDEWRQFQLIHCAHHLSFLHCSAGAGAKSPSA